MTLKYVLLFPYWLFLASQKLALKLADRVPFLAPIPIAVMLVIWHFMFSTLIYLGVMVFHFATGQDTSQTSLLTSPIMMPAVLLYMIPFFIFVVSWFVLAIKIMFKGAQVSKHKHMDLNQKLYGAP